MASVITKPLTIAETTEALGVSLSMVEKLLREGRLKHFKVGKAVRIPVSEIERFIEENTR
jgi:excisionase family DNA binding protein